MSTTAQPVRHEDEDERTIVGVWWLVRARHTFTGPVRTIEFDEGAGIVDETPTATPPAGG